MFKFPKKKVYTLDHLYVLHIRDYRKDKGEEDVIKILKKRLKPFSPMTCTRHVYIFDNLDDSQESLLQSIPKKIEDRTSVCQLMHGKAAYAFLLRWGSGIESTKIDYNDHFVFGTIRKAWNQFLGKKGHKKFVPLVNVWFRDLRQLRSGIQTYLNDVSPHIRVGKVSEACEYCSACLSAGNMPNYKLMKQGFDFHMPDLDSVVSEGFRAVQDEYKTPKPEHGKPMMFMFAQGESALTTVRFLEAIPVEGLKLKGKKALVEKEEKSQEDTVLTSEQFFRF